MYERSLASEPHAHLTLLNDLTIAASRLLLEENMGISLCKEMTKFDGDLNIKSVGNVKVSYPGSFFFIGNGSPDYIALNFGEHNDHTRVVVMHAETVTHARKACHILTNFPAAFYRTHVTVLADVTNRGVTGPWAKPCELPISVPRREEGITAVCALPKKSKGYDTYFAYLTANREAPEPKAA